MTPLKWGYEDNHLSTCVGDTSDIRWYGEGRDSNALCPLDIIPGVFLIKENDLVQLTQTIINTLNITDYWVFHLLPDRFNQVWIAIPFNLSRKLLKTGGDGPRSAGSVDKQSR